MRSQRIAAALSAGWLIAIAAPALAQAQPEDASTGAPGGVHGMIGLGAGVAPDYEGSDDYEAVPLWFGALSYEGVSLEIEGLEGRLDVSPFERLGFGPAVRFRGGRDSGVESEAVSRLEEIDGAVEVGGFVRYGAPLDLLDGDEAGVQLDLLADVSGVHSGAVGSLSASYSFRPLERLKLETTLATTFVTDNYADTYFSISSAGAAASGLSSYQADGGLHDVSLGVSAQYQLTEHWGAMFVLSGSQLVGDAAESPIVEDEGSATQGFAGAGISYGF